MMGMRRHHSSAERFVSLIRTGLREKKIEWQVESARGGHGVDVIVRRSLTTVLSVLFAVSSEAR